MKVTMVEKPWGYERIFARTERYVGKVLFIRAGEALSLQYHRVKDETVHVHTGELAFQIEEAGELIERRLLPGQSVHIPPNTRHRMTAIIDTEVLEVSTPELDDVVRLDDRYGRIGS